MVWLKLIAMHAGSDQTMAQADWVGVQSAHPIGQCRIEATSQPLITKRLAQNVNRPGTEHLIANLLIQDSGNENDRRSPTLPDQSLLQLDAA
jgi:hypothetical protein